MAALLAIGRPLLSAAFCFASCGLSGTALGAYSVSLRLGTIESEANPIGVGIIDIAGPHPDGWFAVSLSEHALASLVKIGPGGSGAATGKPTAGQLRFVKGVNSATPDILRALAKGKSIDQAELIVVQQASGLTVAPFYTVALKGILLTGIGQTVDESGVATEAVTLNYQSIGWSYQARDPKGATVFSGAVHWNSASGEVADGPLPVFDHVPPTARGDTITRLLGQAVDIPVATLLANDDPGATFVQLDSDRSALGVKLAVVNANIAYAPPVPDPGIDDSFSYTIRNAAGHTSHATVNVSVGLPGPRPNLRAHVSSAGLAVRVDVSGGYRFQFQYATALDGHWSNVGTPVTPDASGAIDLTDNAQDSLRFYRIQVVP